MTLLKYGARHHLRILTKNRILTLNRIYTPTGRYRNAYTPPTGGYRSGIYTPYGRYRERKTIALVVIDPTQYTYISEKQSHPRPRIST